MKTDFDHLFSHFLSDDECSPGLRQPNTTDDFVWATDRHALIKVPQRLLDKQYPSHEKAPKVGPVLAATRFLPEPVTIKTKQLMDILGEIPKVKDLKWVTCPDCNGEGGEECICCGHLQECARCDNEGEIEMEDDLAPLVYPFENHGIRIGEAVFSPQIVGTLEAALVELDASEFQLIGGAPNRQHLFRIGEVEVILMPKMDEEPVYVLV
jgi:hypothetical protein